MLIYKRRGLHGLGGCLAAGFSPRLVTVLRDPFERVLSAVYFFLGGARSADARYQALLGGDRPAPFNASDLVAFVRGELIIAAGGVPALLELFKAEGSSRSGSDSGVGDDPPELTRARTSATADKIRRDYHAGIAGPALQRGHLQRAQLGLQRGEVDPGRLWRAGHRPPHRLRQRAP